MNNPLVSVIVPVYNSEKYIHNCINQILKQTYSNIELILVDDGSTDSSGEICESFTDDRIRYFKKPNGGASSARNYGLERAIGDYVYFIDSDDHISEDAIEIMLSAAEDNEADCIYIEADNYADSYDGKIKIGGFIRNNEYKTDKGKNLIVSYIENKDYHVPPFLFFIKRDLLEDLRFEEGIMLEDELFSFVLLMKAQKVVSLKKVLYFRRVRPGSVMTSSGKNRYRFNSISTVFEKIYEMYRNESDDPVIICYMKRIALLWLSICETLSKSEMVSVENKYSAIRKLILSNKGFGSREAIVRCYGKLLWYAYIAPGRVVKRIKRKIK